MEQNETKDSEFELYLKRVITRTNKDMGEYGDNISDYDWKRQWEHNRELEETIYRNML